VKPNGSIGIGGVVPPIRIDDSPGAIDERNQNRLQAASVGAPQTDRTVPTACEQVAPIGRVRNSIDIAKVPFETVNFSP
jgi:hypothetical protein